MGHTEGRRRQHEVRCQRHSHLRGHPAGPRPQTASAFYTSITRPSVSSRVVEPGALRIDRLAGNRLRSTAFRGRPWSGVTGDRITREEGGAVQVSPAWLTPSPAVRARAGMASTAAQAEEPTGTCGRRRKGRRRRPFGRNARQADARSVRMSEIRQPERCEELCAAPATDPHCPRRRRLAAGRCGRNAPARPAAAPRRPPPAAGAHWFSGVAAASAKRPTRALVGRNVRETVAHCEKIWTRSRPPKWAESPANGTNLSGGAARLKIVVSTDDRGMVGR
jgi:hypothetical protein